MCAGNCDSGTPAGTGQKPPAQLGYGTQSLTIFVDDVDGHYARARARGAKILEEPHETEYGDYQYAVQDLDGHHWLFSRHAKVDRSPEEWGQWRSCNGVQCATRAAWPGEASGVRRR